MNLLIQNGRLIDPLNKIDTKMDILIKDGKIFSVKPKISSDEIKCDKKIDATGMWVTPGLIDMHVHLRDPGQLHKETIKTGTNAAAAGGFTTVCCMPNTSPTIDNEKTVKYIIETAEQESPIRVIPIGSITKKLEGKELSDYFKMKEAGIRAISDDGKTVENPDIYKAAMEQVKILDMPILAHCEPEEEIIKRDINFAREINARLHICHVSTKTGVDLIRAAKKNGQQLTAEVTPHHFTLTAEDIPKNDGNYKMSPPIRTRADREAILEALKDGTIDVIATDHAPHHEDEKNCDYVDALNGIIGLETAVPLAISELVNTGILSPPEMILKFMNPAKILGLDTGNLSVGANADITIIDPLAEFIIDKNSFKSLSKNTPFHGRKVKGRVVYTICQGRIKDDYRQVN